MKQVEWSILRIRINTKVTKIEFLKKKTSVSLRSLRAFVLKNTLRLFDNRFPTSDDLERGVFGDHFLQAVVTEAHR